MNAALLTMLRSAILFGGLVIIVDLGSTALTERVPPADLVEQIRSVDTILNVVLFSILGAVVARQTRLFYLSLVAGLIAAALDAAVVLAASSMAPQAGSAPIEEYLLTQLELGVVPAAISGFVSSLIERTSSSGGPRPR